MDFNKIIPFFFPKKNINFKCSNNDSISFGSVIYIYDKDIEYQYKVSGIIISDDRICIQLNKKVNGENFLTVKISIDKCDEKISSFFIKHQYKKYVNSKEIKELSKMKKNCFKFLKKNLEVSD